MKQKDSCGPNGAKGGMCSLAGGGGGGRSHEVQNAKKGIGGRKVFTKERRLTGMGAVPSQWEKKKSLAKEKGKESKSDQQRSC